LKEFLEQQRAMLGAHLNATLVTRTDIRDLVARGARTGLPAVAKDVESCVCDPDLAAVGILSCHLLESSDQLQTLFGLYRSHGVAVLR
jgi:hypothetical protein